MSVAHEWVSSHGDGLRVWEERVLDGREGGLTNDIIYSLFFLFESEWNHVLLDD